MKQQITKEQMRELSDRMQAKLDLWLIRHGYGDNAWPHMNIGQMIEFLDECQFPKIEEWDDGEGSRKVVTLINIENEKLIKARYKATELCDALWEAVKEVLEEK